jgi:predicted DCC family thiol-disulfide oxidoreductase YuxK
MANQDELYYDSNCPMCKWYSGKLVRFGMLENEGRCDFSEIQNRVDSGIIDLDKAKNFIPLFVTNENKTLYGVDSLLYLIGKKFPKLARLGNLKIIYWLSTKLYKLISYNRRIIVPNNCQIKKDTAMPDYNVKYRLLFILIAALISSAITLVFSLHFPDSLNIFLAIGAGWIAFFSFSLMLLPIRKSIDLVGHTSVVMLRGVLIFGLSILTFSLGWYSILFIPILIAWAFLDMNLQMKKRVKHQGLPINHYFLWLACLCGTCGIILTLTQWTL